MVSASSGSSATRGTMNSATRIGLVDGRGFHARGALKCNVPDCVTRTATRLANAVIGLLTFQLENETISRLKRLSDATPMLAVSSFT